MLPGTTEIVENILRERARLRFSKDPQDREYAHILGFLATAIRVPEMPLEEKRELFKRRAEALLKTYGDKFESVMAPELREALGLETPEKNK